MKNLNLTILIILISQFALFASEKNIKEWAKYDNQENKIVINDKSYTSLKLHIQSVPHITNIQYKYKDDTYKDLQSFTDYLSTNDSITVFDLEKIIDQTKELNILASPKNTDSFFIKIIAGGDSKEFIFSFNNNKDGKENTNVSMTKIPVPFFIYDSNEFNTKPNNVNRILIIDANPNPQEKLQNSLYKLENDKLVSANSIKVNSSLSIFITNYNIGNIDEINISVNGEDYSYTKDLSDLLKIVNISERNSANGEIYTEDDEEKVSDDTINLYLKPIVERLDKVSFVNINDYIVFKSFVDTITKVSYDIKLSLEAQSNLSKLINWKPNYISLTPIANLGPDSDEVEISLTTSERNKKQIYPIGKYKTYGGSVTQVSTSIFVTNLVNNKIYTDSLSVPLNDSTNHNELRAMIKDRDIAVGLGLNIETSFRTGCAIRPTINAGMFVPFEEDITPYISFGVGGAIVLKDIKFSLSGGLAGGFVNEINTKYLDKDLSKYPNYAEDLYDKVPKLGWQVSFGVSFNLN